jgi:hypothetical protein
MIKTGGTEQFSEPEKETHNHFSHDFHREGDFNTDLENDPTIVYE